MQESKIMAEGQHNNEVGVFDVLGRSVKSWKLILSLGVVGLIGSWLYLTVAPLQFEATATIEMAQISNRAEKDISVSSVETPGLLANRLKNPVTYTPETIKACGLGGHTLPAEELAEMVRVSTPANLASVMVIKIRRDSQELAERCLSTLVEVIRDHQEKLKNNFQRQRKATLNMLENRLRLENEYLSARRGGADNQAMVLIRRDQILYLTQQIDGIKRELTEGLPTRLITPIYVSPNPIYPKRTVILVLGFMMGSILGFLIAFGRSCVNNASFKHWTQC